MSKLLISVVLLVLVAESYQLSCWYGTSQQTGGTEIVQTTPVQCPGSQYCMKIYQKNLNYNNYQTNSYGCGNTACASSGCNENKNGYGTCCCRGNMCNSGFDYSKTAISSMILTIASVVYIYL